MGTAGLTRTRIQGKLNEVIQFLDPLLPLANSHMVDFITTNLWELLTPNDVKTEVACTEVCIKELFHKAFYSIFDKEWKCSPTSKNNNMSVSLSAIETDIRFSEQLSKISQFLSNAKTVSESCLSDALTRAQLREKLTVLGSGLHTSLHLDQFMTCKKAHEVEVMSEVVASLANACHASHIVDVGSGKGYLSSMLALHHGLHVLGIDSSQVTTHGAVTRTKKLVKVWNGISKKAKLDNRSFKNKTHQNTIDNDPKLKTTKTDATANNQLSEVEKCKYKQATLFVMPDINLPSLIENHFPESYCQNNITLVGLHTCGGLSPTTFHIFSSNERVKGLCNVGCCYHLLTEEFEVENKGTQKEAPEHQFPLSAFLQSKQFVLGRNARMLAAQSVDRIINTQLSLESIYYRAVLQVLLKEKLGNDMPEANVGRLASKCNSFSQYVHKALGRLGMNLKVSDEECETLYAKHSKDRDYLHAFYIMRLALAPVIERVLLLDKLLFLHEQGIEDSYIVQMFDPVVSPRCFGIVAWKT